MSKRYKLTLAYDGTDYVGWQSQKNGTAIQDVIQQAFLKITKKKVSVIGSGRTDAGVHAIGQVAHCDLAWNHTVDELRQALNAHLPTAIQINQITAVDLDFHAQYSARRKWYRYVLATTDIMDIFTHRYVTIYPYAFKIQKMRQAATFLKGRHDFKSFQGSGSVVKSTTRVLSKLTIRPTKLVSIPFATAQEIAQLQWSTKGIIFDFVGEGFLKQMVRNIVGTLLEVGEGKKIPQQIKKILKQRDRRVAGRCAPPQGLYLMKVSY